MRSVSCCLVCSDNDDGERVAESSKRRTWTQRALRSAFVLQLSVCLPSAHGWTEAFSSNTTENTVCLPPAQ